MTACPCQSGQRYSHCCQPLHDGQPAATAAALMRSRYSAFALQLSAYLLRSWHASTRPAQLDLDADCEWLGLTIEQAAEQGERAQVSFCARFRAAGRFQQLRERSNFVCEQGHWYYLDGDAHWSEWAIGRNDPCPCGSGRKFKRCCG
ncbi:UPF0225 protein YchJ [Bacterioplanes sanyensis]|uniref:YchJ family protein n=1 Tax=Bacterioplanes sanyensis TaxID=1249553 RepID=UPI001675CA5C|nr:YchJ family protein [Bacterioplanes sanyensis]GGY38627.1 UPF0225 protein YchJ [Bacterioplanes sanyensis]